MDVRFTKVNETDEDVQCQEPKGEQHQNLSFPKAEKKKDVLDENTTHDETAPAKATETRPEMDTAWSWVVNAGVFCTLMISMGIQRSYGLFYVEMQERYQVSASAMSLVGSTISATFSVGALIVMTFVLKVLTERQCVLLGVFLMTSAFSLSSLVTSFPVLVFSLGAIPGISISLMYGPMFVLLNKYFSRHLTLAQAIGNTGVSVGSLLMPLLLRAILDEFSFPGGMLVIGGIVSEMFIFAMIFRPIVQKRTPASASSVDTLDPCEDRVENNNFSVPKNHDSSVDNFAETLSSAESADSWAVELEQFQRPVRSRTFSENDKDRLTVARRTKASRRSLQTEIPVLLPAESMSNNNDSHDHSVLEALLLASSWAALPTTPESFCASRLSAINSTPAKPPDKERNATSICWRFCNAKMCKNIPMWTLVLWQAFGFQAGGLGPAFLPSLAKEKWLSDQQATFLLTLLGGLDIVSRLLPGLVAHLGLLKPHHMVILCLILQGLLCQFMAFFNTFEALLGFCVGFGLLSGVLFSMTQAVIIHYVGLDGFPLVFGFIQLAIGVSGAIGYPIVGALRDWTGSYVTSFYYLGATGFVSAALLMSLPYLCRLQNKMEAERDNANAEQDVVVPLTQSHKK